MEQSGGKDMALAFLSACETATGDREIPDDSEALHLAATLLIAGFQSVVATMWYVLID
jgi:CHAT domain-containing protein